MISRLGRVNRPLFPCCFLKAEINEDQTHGCTASRKLEICEISIKLTAFWIDHSVTHQFQVVMESSIACHWSGPSVARTTADSRQSLH
jgi:hypothetical protein